MSRSAWPSWSCSRRPGPAALSPVQGGEQVARYLTGLAARAPGSLTLLERTVNGQALDESERLARSSLIASQLMGLAFMRYVWKIEPIATMTEDDLVAAIAPTIQRYLDGNIGPAAQPQGHPTTTD